MTLTPSTPRLSMTYPTARVRGRLVTRFPEKTLGWTVLDAATAEEMGREQIGWFVGNHPGPKLAAEQFACLDTHSEGGVWVVVPHSRDSACELFERWPRSDHLTGRPTSKNSMWRSRKVWVAIPEDLKQLLPLARGITPGLAGVPVAESTHGAMSIATTAPSMSSTSGPPSTWTAGSRHSSCSPPSQPRRLTHKSWPGHSA